jgi:hypothetical protein
MVYLQYSSCLYVVIIDKSVSQYICFGSDEEILNILSICRDFQWGSTLSCVPHIDNILEVPE